tara:strand:+ start:12625 stop:12783 length:159 start_codon:yes stop_codon:yes gene_type:complete
MSDKTVEQLKQDYLDAKAAAGAACADAWKVTDAAYDTWQDALKKENGDEKGK